MNYFDENNPRLKPETRPDKKDAFVFRKSLKNFNKILNNQLTLQFAAQDVVRSLNFTRKQVRRYEKL